MINFSSIGYKFTPKQMAALQHYMKNGNAVAAYRSSYDCSRMQTTTINQRAADLFKKWYMVAALELVRAEAMNQLNKEAEQLVIDAKWVLQKSVMLANFNIRKFLRVDDLGNAVYDFSNATDDDWYCISEYTVDEIFKGQGDDRHSVDRIKVKGFDKLRALELVGKHIDIQAFKENVGHTGVITQVHMDKDEYKQARREMLEGDDC